MPPEFNRHWQIVPLSEVVRHRKEFSLIDDASSYKRCRVQLHAKGIVLRDELEGAAIKTKKQQVCRAGQLLVAEIDAKLGGYGIVPEELEGAIVSSHYFLFDVETSKLDRAFLGYFIRTPYFHDQVGARGSTNYAAIRPTHVLGYRMPLPPFAEQRRIVAKIEALVAKIEEVRGLKTGVSGHLESLCRSLLRPQDGEVYEHVAMNELVRLRTPNVHVTPTESYSFAGVYCFGRGLFQSGTKTGMEFAYKRLTRLRAGDFVYPKLMAWEGALAAVPHEYEGLVVSPEFPVFEVNRQRVLPETLDTHFRSPSVWPRLAELSTGTNVRRRRLNPADFLRYEFPLPPISNQETLRSALGAVDRLKTLQSQTAAELDALLPSILDKAFKGEL